VSGAFFFIDIEIIVFKSFKSIHTRSNGYKIFIVCFTNNYVCISSTFLLKTKQKAIANYLWLWYLWLVTHVNAEMPTTKIMFLLIKSY